MNLHHPNCNHIAVVGDGDEKRRHGGVVLVADDDGDDVEGSPWWRGSALK